MESTEATDGGRRLDSARTVSTNITSLKNKRAAVKRRITNTLKKLESTIEQYGRKAIIRGYVNNLQEYLNEAKGLNDKLISVIPETEHEATLDWYEEQLERVEDAKLQANAHLDERAEESSSGLSSVKSCKTSTTRTLSQAAEIRAKMTSAEIKAKQLALEEQRRTVEFEKQLEVKRKLELVQDEAQRLKFMAQERRKTQEAKDEAARLAAEAAILEKVQNTVNDPETLSNRLLDFVDDSLKFIPSSIPDEPLPIVPQPLPGLLQEAGANDGTVLPTNNTTEAVTPSLLLQHPKSAISFKTPKVMEKSKETLPLYHSWIGDLQSGVQHPPLTSTDNRKTTICGHPTRDSLPKLRLSKFDGDPLHWSDWSSMFKSIVHDANLSLNGKMQHLQNSVIGKAKSAIEGYGYSGDSYYEALKELETRFGKPSLVVKVTLDKLKKTARLQNDKPQEVRNLSDVVSTTVWTFKKFGYESDLKAEANVSLAVDKLSQELKIKWKDNTKTTNLERPSLVDFSVWLKGQADIYDDCCYPSKFPSRPNKNKTGGSNGLNERQNTFSSNLSPHPKTTKFSCIMCDGQEHKLSSCPRFKVLSVEERLNEVQKHKLCFSCFSPKHWFSNCSNKKQCGVNGCTRSHNALLHNLRNVSSVESSDAVSAINPEAQAEVGLSTEHSNTSHRSSHTSVLLQVVPVTLYGPKGYFNTYAMLDTGSTCSLLLADVARRLGLDGPLESVVLNGIQKTSELVTKRVNVQVSQVNDFGTQFDVNGVLVVDHLNVPEKKVKLKELQERWPHLSDLELTEVAGTQVTLLLGSDVPELIVPLETRHGPKGSPVGVRTGIGWTVTGRLRGHIQECESVCKVHVATPDEELNETVKTWWRTENFGCRNDNDTQRSVEDERVMKFLDENTRKVDGRYEVPLIWRNDKVELPDNFAAAAQCLNFLEKKLNRNPELAERYRKTIDMDMEKGYIKRLTKEETTAPVMRKWYLPHHPVLNPKKPEKVRRVCDAAAKFQGSSLNSQLLSGPDLLNNLVGIFMRFREEKVALSGDIEAMFNQVAVPEEDQACLRFLWRQSPDLPTEVYQYVRHIFGAKCAPTCSNYALLRSAEDNEKQFPSAALAVTWTGVVKDSRNDFLSPAKYSSLIKLLKVTAYLIRFIYNCKHPKSERRIGSLMVEEMEQARKFWICVAQAESFPQEVAVLKLKQHVSSKSKLVSLSPFLDEHGIIRAGGRIERADIPFCSRHPVVLAPDHELTRLIIMNCHEKLKHEGVDHVRNELRQQYWILRCRATVRKILHQCSYCRRRKVKPEAPLMASLPYDRLSVAPPFSKVGVDFFGPLKVKHLRKQEKRYGCLFTCLVTRAVHLEVAFSLSTDSFIMCLRRFMARRGKPTVIYSDNGTNFVGANNELRECIDDWNQHKIGSVLSQEGIQWVFNPPAAPHMGGVWERLVRSCKKALNVVLQNQVLTDEVLQTAFAEVEWVVNSRPLTQVTSDLDDLEALTPNHFLIGRGSLNLPPGIFVDKEISSRKRWRQAQVVANHIWNRWLREYLPGLITRKKWTQPTVNVKVGDLVLVVDRAASRGSWPLGRIVKVFPGLDSIVRSADVKTKFGVMRRPVTKLAVLEECSTN